MYHELWDSIAEVHRCVSQFESLVPLTNIVFKQVENNLFLLVYTFTSNGGLGSNGTANPLKK